MPDTKTDLFMEVLAESLETMAFMSVMPADDPTQSPIDPLSVSIQYNFMDRYTGTVRLVCARMLGQALAANMLGVEPTSDEAVSAAPDVLKELMNVTCGVLMRRLSGVPSDGLSMSLPVAVELPVSEWNGITADTDTIVLDVEGSNAALKVTGME